MSHKYYSPLRPLSLGTFPKPQGNEILHIENFKERQNVPEIARQAYKVLQSAQELDGRSKPAGGVYVAGKCKERLQGGLYCI